MRRWIALAALLVMGLGCDSGCDRGCEAETPREVDAVQLSEMVPEDAEVVVFTDRLGELIQKSDRLFEVVPLSTEAPGRVRDWRAVGGAVDKPAVAFWSRGQWVVVAAADHELETDIDAWGGEAVRTEVGSGPIGPKTWREYTSSDGEDEGDWRRWMSTDGAWIIAGWRGESEEDVGPEPLDDEVWELKERGAWVVDADQKYFWGDDGGNFAVRGAVDGRAMLARFDGDDRAGDLLEQLMEQVGIVYWGLRDTDDAKRHRIELYTPGERGTPRAIRDLGAAGKELPDLGGLIQPGTPGVVRFSADPWKFVELLRSTLEVEERQRLDATLTMLRDQLQVDLEKDVIDNLTGHVAVVIFGIEDSFFDVESGLEMVASSSRLQTVRNAVILPFEDREAIESVLDVFTQISQGGLRRDAGEQWVRYAWFDDGVLEWAILVGDEHLAFVDSMIAHDQVRRWERSPGTLEDVFVDRGVDAMLASKRGLGLYLDTATLRTVIEEGGDEKMAAWLEPLEAVRGETDVEGRPERADVEFWLRGTDSDEREE